MAGNMQNLRPFTKETASYYGKKGAKASAEARKKRKSMKEQLEALLTLKIRNENVINQLRKLGVKNSDLNNQTAILLKMINKAQQGDVRAAEFVRDTSGENPNKIEVEVTSSGVTESIIEKLKERKNGFD